MATNPRLIDPTYWRSRAEEARVMAGSMRDLESKRILNGIATNYDKLAAMAERLVKYTEK